MSYFPCDGFQSIWFELVLVYMKSPRFLAEKKKKLLPKKTNKNGGFIRYKGILLAKTPFWCFLNVVIAMMTLQKIIFLLTSNKNNIK